MSGYLEHLTLEGDRWDLLAYRYYGSTFLTVPLLEANPDQAHHLVLPGGLRLQIPILESVQVSAPDQEEIGGLPWL